MLASSADHFSALLGGDNLGIRFARYLCSWDAVTVLAWIRSSSTLSTESGVVWAPTRTHRLGIRQPTMHVNRPMPCPGRPCRMAARRLYIMRVNKLRSLHLLLPWMLRCRRVKNEDASV